MGGAEYRDLDEIYAEADIISLHVPLCESTRHMINAESIKKMKRGVMVINCARGGLIDTAALIEGLKSNKVGAAGLDVYENEADLFFKDFTRMSFAERMSHLDAQFALLVSFSQVIVTPHSAFLTKEALANICSTTLLNAKEFIEGKNPLTNELSPQEAVGKT